MATEEPAVVVEVAAPAIEADVTVVVEKEPALEAAAEKPTKGKKTSTKRKTTIPSLHPPYFEMIKDAIATLKEKTGSSQYAIAKFVEEKQKNLPEKFKKVLLIQLKRLVAEGKLVKVKASYKLPAVKAPAKTKPAAKPKTSAKPKPAAKKAPVKKKPATKPKPAPKAKAVAKPKIAAKPKPVAKPKAAAPKAVAKPAAKAKPKTPTKPAKVARTSTRSTPGKKGAPAPKTVKVAKTSTRSTPRKVAAAVAKPVAKKAAAKKSAATRKSKK